MITLRRNDERRHERRRKQEMWATFHSPGEADPLAGGFGALEVFNEDRLPPNAGSSRCSEHDVEVVTYVREGALSYRDSTGRSGVIHAGEFRCMTAARRVQHEQANTSRTDWAHVFQIWLGPAEPGLEPGHEQKRFGAGERRGGLCVVASHDARRGSLFIHQDILMYSALLDPGQHVIHELCPGRSAWLHVVQGAATLGEIALTTGDAAGVTAERAVSLTAREATEILLIDLGERPPDPQRRTARSRPTSP